MAELTLRHETMRGPITGLRNERRATYKRHMTVTVAAALTALLILSPASTQLFATPFGYLIEAPIAGLVLFFLLCGAIPNAVAAKTVKVSVVAFFVLLPFAVIAALRGIGFGHIYSDFRALFLLAVVYRVLTCLSRETSLSFVRQTSVLMILIWLLAYGVSGAEDLFPQLQNARGKTSVPIISLLVLFVLGAADRKALFVLALIAGLVFSLSNGYRYVYVGTALGAVSVVLVWMIRWNRAVGIVTMAMAALVLTYLVLSGTALPLLVELIRLLERLLVALGAPGDVIGQVVDKTLRSLSGAPLGERGEGLYLVYLQNAFNFGKFVFPHGFGQGATIGSPDLFYGNSIDSSVIYVNYHLSIWVAIALYAWGAGLLVRSFVRSGLATTLALILAATPFLFVLYFRALPFTTATAAIETALLLFSLTNLFGVLSRSRPRRRHADTVPNYA